MLNNFVGKFYSCLKQVKINNKRYLFFVGIPSPLMQGTSLYKNSQYKSCAIKNR